jgi:hypothetical protein
MAKRKQLDEHEALRPGWTREERAPLEEKRLPSLANQGAINGWVSKASARSGPKFAPGTGKSS